MKGGGNTKIKVEVRIRIDQDGCTVHAPHGPRGKKERLPLIKELVSLVGRALQAFFVHNWMARRGQGG